MARAVFAVTACLAAAACSSGDDGSVPAPSPEEARAVAGAQAMIPPAEQAAASAAAQAPAASPAAGTSGETPAPGRPVKPHFATPLPQASRAQ